ncbi:MAG: hypothetical protein ACOYVJ_06625 [Nitrospirota bacterium]
MWHIIEYALPIGQGAYYSIMGLWGVLNLRTFLKVTGYKTDYWLVKTVGLMLVVIGLALITGGIRKNITPELAVLGAGTACALMGIDIYYVSVKRISRIYLLDAVIEMFLIMAWIMQYFVYRALS